MEQNLEGEFLTFGSIKMIKKIIVLKRVKKHV